MTRDQARRLALALIAQVMVCLGFAPVLGARQLAQQASSRQSDAPREESGIQAGQEALESRPEETGDARKRRGKTRAPTLAASLRQSLPAATASLPNNSPDAFDVCHPRGTFHFALNALAPAAENVLPPMKAVALGGSLQPTGPPIGC